MSFLANTNKYQSILSEQNLLSNLLDTIQNYNDSSNVYFNYIGKYEVSSPILQVNPADGNEPDTEELFAQLGIRSLATTNLLDSFILPKVFTSPGWVSLNQSRWHEYKITRFIDDLKGVFKNCRVITFSDWVAVEGASELWDGLRFDVIKPLDRKDFNFIFHLGDPSKKFSFEVDEILDIISDFSHYGQVTLVLTELEAVKLWKVIRGLDGESPTEAGTQGLNEKCQTIFDAMHIKNLLIYAVDRAILQTRQQHFEIATRKFTNVKISGNVKDHFSDGYSLGLLLQMEISHCIALGLMASGAYLQNGINPDRDAILSYIKRRISELAPWYS